MSTSKRWFGDTSVETILSLSMLEPLGPACWQKIFNSFDSLGSVLKASPPLLAKAGLTDHQATCLKERPQQVDSAKRLLASKQIGVITLDSSEYPPLLKEINDPPLWLFYRGNLEVLKRPAVTVVGTRKPSAYALAAMEKVLAEEILSQLCVISGLAYGVDKKAHQLTLKAGGETAAVLAGGLDSIYPVDHARLAEEIVKSDGLLLSEYPPLCRPRPAKFPIRNRIIAGLSPLTIVIEAMTRSGSLTTAASAINYNRDVWAIPGDITRVSAEGTNFLIKQGATLLDSSSQLADYYGLKAKTTSPRLDTNAEALLNLLARQALSVDQIAGLTDQAVPEILGILTELELSSLVYQSQPGYYQAKKS